jgi:hypothetical protein
MTLSQELFAIRDRMGELTPVNVVNAARQSPGDYSEVHSGLEWDDAIAGEAHRVRQAADMIRSVRIKFVRPNGEVSSVRQFHAIPQPDEARHIYEPVEEIAHDPLQRRMVLAQMNREWLAFKARYQHLDEFMELIERESGAA